MGTGIEAGEDRHNHGLGRSRRRIMGGRNIRSAPPGEDRRTGDRRAVGGMRGQDWRPQPATAEGLFVLVLELRMMKSGSVTQAHYGPPCPPRQAQSSLTAHFRAPPS